MVNLRSVTWINLTSVELLALPSKLTLYVTDERKASKHTDVHCRIQVRTDPLQPKLSREADVAAQRSPGKAPWSATIHLNSAKTRCFCSLKLLQLPKRSSWRTADTNLSCCLQETLLHKVPAVTLSRRPRKLLFAASILSGQASSPRTLHITCTAASLGETEGIPHWSRTSNTDYPADLSIVLNRVCKHRAGAKSARKSQPALSFIQT